MPNAYTFKPRQLQKGQLSKEAYSSRTFYAGSMLYCRIFHKTLFFTVMNNQLVHNYYRSSRCYLGYSNGLSNNMLSNLDGILLTPNTLCTTPNKTKVTRLWTGEHCDGLCLPAPPRFDLTLSLHLIDAVANNWLTDGTLAIHSTSVSEQNALVVSGLGT